VIAVMGLKLQLFAKGARQRRWLLRHDQVELLFAAGPELAMLWLAAR
jgi:hypothetical protein